MKNVIKEAIFFAIILIFSTIFIVEVKAEGLSCDQIPVDFCPIPGIDANGNACTKGYNGSVLECTKNLNAKTCPEKYADNGKCPSTDDFGNKCKIQYEGAFMACTIIEKSVYKPLKTCTEYSNGECPSSDYKGNICSKDSQGQCYVSKSKQKCEELKSKGLCNGRSNECVWTTNSKGTYACFSLIEPTEYSPACNTVTDKLTCELRTDCKNITNSKGHNECASIIKPDSSSEVCEKLTNLNECELREDCDIITNSKGTKECAKIIVPDSSSISCSSIYNKNNCRLRTDCELSTNSSGVSICVSKNGSVGNSGNGIKIVKTRFKCSDVKYLTGAWMFIRILAPFIIVLFGSLDFFKAIIASDEKKMKEARGRFPKRLIAFFLLIILPFLVQFIFSHIGTYGSENVCLVKCIVTNDTSSKGCE